MKKLQIDGVALKSLFGAGVANVAANVALINELNVFPVPDGDTGANLYHTLQRAWREIANTDEAAVSTVANRFAHGALMGARGNSGTIMSQLLTGFADCLQNSKVLTAPLFVDACGSAVARAYASVSQPVEGTILTVAREAAASLRRDHSLDILLATLVSESRKSLDNTPNLLPLLKDAGVVDAGGMGLLCFLQGMSPQNCGGARETAPMQVKAEPATLPSIVSEAYGYDVQFLMLGADLDVDAARQAMERLGWSVVVAGDSSAVKVHVHVDNPALPLDYAVKAGATLTDVVIENMELQARDFARLQERQPGETGHPAASVIAVAEGAGMKAIFRDLSCYWIIDGGAARNPSIEDLLSAIERCPSDKVIVLPNHKDVVLAAAQAAKIQSGKRVAVLPTRTMAQGISAMVALGDASDKGADFEATIAAMHAAADAVTSIQIARATRSTCLDGLTIRERDYIAIVDGAIRVAAADIGSALKDALVVSGVEGRELVTLYCGADFNAESADALIERLLSTIKGIEFEVVNGGQALYPLIASVE